MTCSDEAGVSVLKRSLCHKLCMQQYDNLTQDYIHVVLVDHVSCLGCCSAPLDKTVSVSILYGLPSYTRPKGTAGCVGSGFQFLILRLKSSRLL